MTDIMSEMEESAAGIPIFDADRELIEEYGRPIAAFFDDDRVTSILVNRFDQVYVRREGKFVLTEARWDDERALINFIKQTARTLGQDADEESRPISDARMPDGSRINAVLYPTAHRGSNMTIRLFPKVRFSGQDLLERGMFSGEMLEFLKIAVTVEANVLVAGASGSGKTTLLNAMANMIPEEARIAVIEDTAELYIDKPNMVAMEAPRRALKIDDPVTMERLLVNLLRQESDRTVVGEIRDPGAATALQIALNTGQRGVMSTLHAGSAEKALRRLEVMLLSNDSRVPFETVRADIRDSIDVIVYVERTPCQGLRVVQLAELDESGEVRLLWEWDFAEGRHVRRFEGHPRIFRLGVKHGLNIEMCAVPIQDL